MTQPIFSVCIPTWNGSTFISETVESVLKSTLHSFEIIVNDDCSSDNSIEKVINFNDERIRIFINKIKAGVPANWNMTLNKAKGKYICFLNQDDIISPFWLEYACRIFDKYQSVGWIISAFWIIDEYGSITREGKIQRFTDNRAYSPEEAMPIALKLDGFGPGFCFRRQVLDNLQGFDETIGPSADNEFFIRMASRFHLFYSKCPHLSWRSHSQNLTKRWSTRAQTLEGYRTLRKTFFYNSLPSQFFRFRDDAYQYFHKKTCRKLIDLLNKHNYSEFRAVVKILAEEIGSYPVI